MKANVVSLAGHLYRKGCTLSALSKDFVDSRGMFPGSMTVYDLERFLCMSDSITICSEDFPERGVDVTIESWNGDVVEYKNASLFKLMELRSMVEKLKGSMLELQRNMNMKSAKR